MSNIKFRVWDGENYHYPDCGENRTNYYLQIGSDGAFFLHNAEGVFITSSFIGGVLELFTGLQDIRGVDIYENDILNTPERIYENKQNIFVKGENYVYFEDAMFKINNLSLVTLRHYEVVGNIHENEIR